MVSSDDATCIIFLTLGGFSPDPADRKGELEFEDWFSPDPADRRG